MMPISRTVCILDDGARVIRELSDLLDSQEYCVFLEEDADRFITMIADIDPDLIVIPDATSVAEEYLIPMLRLLTDNIIVVTVNRDGDFAAEALLRGADLCVSRAMPERELLARLHAFERRLLAPTA
ncbi:MAG: hypothetical protein IIC85_07710 [Chloroflexi bacterium]|nr:hypothetical protein [Chloroflexota bacterium]